MLFVDMTPQPAKMQAVGEMYELLRRAAVRRRLSSGKLRWPAPTALSPCVGPESRPAARVVLSVWRKQQQRPADDDEGVGGWRCLAVEKLSQVELRAEAWHTEPRSRRQTCIDEVDFDVDAQPEEDPQKGQ